MGVTEYHTNDTNASSRILQYDSRVRRPHTPGLCRIRVRDGSKMADHTDVEQENAGHAEARSTLVTVRYAHVNFLGDLNCYLLL